ncbi:AAA family ATPase [Candidatus Glomeribacter gigasporarum]|uniref:AAA family ATPase n=1 Tax=Candidatus Glomeribacter gigasporarum TaxID=132144 RepID=UPI0002E7CC8C|nr:AAA family ATPase [Candidatus Glomeribacter gigasporarum]
MSFPIITADERLAEPRGVKGVLIGKSGIGKTLQLWTLPAESTLFFDLEAGDLAVEGWLGDTLRPRTWAECRDLAVFFGGPNPALRSDHVDFSGKKPPLNHVFTLAILIHSRGGDEEMYIVETLAKNRRLYPREGKGFKTIEGKGFKTIGGN